MDPIAHTLTGAALGESGLKRRSALGMATLMIGANLPDIDAFAMPFARHLEFRRGLTHGVLAMVVLPFALTGVMLAWDRLVRRRGGRVPQRPVIPSQILLLAAISIVSHPLLDFLNTYGVRLLMPFSSRWFFGDALFIVDPWVLLVLVGGIVIARREARWARQRAGAGVSERDDHAPLFPTPARAALVLVVLYAVAMLGSNVAARAHVHQVLRAQGITYGPFMISPVPVNPFRRDVVVENGDHYLFGRFTWLPRRFELTGHSLPRNAAHPAARAAAATPEGRGFLDWSRFPFFVIDMGEQETRVHIADLRYAINPRDSWAARTIVIPREEARNTAP